MKDKRIFLYGLLLQVVCFMSCEKAYTGEEEGNEPGLPNVTFKITNFEQIPFEDAIYGSRATDGMGGICTRIDLAVFDQEGTKVKGTKQEITDKNFGTLSLSIPQGDYQLVVLAHSGTGAATMSSPDKITFKDNKVTDTFYHYGNMTVDENNSFNISLERAVAMFRLITNGNTPSEVKQMKFYYTGGSSTFNAQTGFGCVNSRQTEIRDVESSAYNAAAKYEVYTFPHDTEGELKITVTALNASGTDTHEREFTNVPVRINRITQYNGTFFEGQGQTGKEFTLSANKEWTQTEEYDY